MMRAASSAGITQATAAARLRPERIRRPPNRWRRALLRRIGAA